MHVQNKEIADKFKRLADLLEIQGANQFRVRAYRNAAQTINAMPKSASDSIADGEDLSELAGIGDDLAQKIEEIVETGELSLLKETEEDVAPALSDLMRIRGLGAKRVRIIHRELGVDSIADLKAAAEQGEIRALDGFGAKTEEKILRELARLDEGKDRTKLVDAEPVAGLFREYLADIDGVKDVVVAGSYRRRKETVGDLDILVTCKNNAAVMKKFVEQDDVDDVVSHGKTKSSVRLRTGLRIDLRVVPQKSFGAALYYFTGSKAHNVAVRKIAKGKGLKINEYGVFKGQKRVAGETEESVFKAAGLDYVPPELRENRGEIEAAKDGSLPDLVEKDDLRGNLHTHTKATDGKYSLREMADAAEDLRLDYLAITDHSKAITMAKGLDEKRLEKQMRAIQDLNKELNGLRLLTGVEVDILEDGSLDLDEKLLDELDVVVASVHQKLELPKQKQTERLIRAMDRPCVNIIGHPTGRLINSRPPYDVDIDELLQAAADRGCHVELNAQPDRLDLKDTHCQLAKEVGVKVSIACDAHSKSDLELLKWGLDQARRGWLEKDDVLNTRTWKKLRPLLNRR